MLKHDSASEDVFSQSFIRNDHASNPPPLTHTVLPFPSTAREFDMETRLYDHRARAYSPALGRYLQFDPTDFWGGDRHLRRYVSNDPISIVDLLGLWQHYENWGGPGWTNGQHQSETDNFPMPGQPGFRPPVDARDHAYFAHDVCLHNCSTIRCPGPRRNCRRQCDKELANDLRDIGGPFLEILLFDWFMPNNNTGEFNPHAERFPRIEGPGFTD